MVHTHTKYYYARDVKRLFFLQVGLIENGYLICGGTYVIGTGGVVKVITAAHCLSR
ncbi:hypothetical protein DPMN_035489 [Dreissena polymorpha]|uniref:Peptidase S1 domain-containing protein n=1 Tax=Dreissena polymorpha TaxID=45954 RepID=A0A9D4MAP0_DREPO|nr:hypothetical protein DPMN_035489 [Dreissena polymorpha]